MKRLFLLCTALFALHVFAQTDLQRAKELFRLIQEGKGDSCFVRFNKEAQAHVSAKMFDETFSQLERQFGTYQSHSEWGIEQLNGYTIYYTDVTFEKYTLRLLTAFDEDGLANTIRFVPAPAKSTAPTAEINRALMEEKEINVVCGAFTLPGTLTLPKNKTNVPLVIMVHGSGPNDRDETIGPNKPFRDLAWGLAERGIASIRYDKRTKVYGAESATDERFTFDEETVDDAVAAVHLAKSTEKVDTLKVFVLGHSQGAMLAPRIAEKGAPAGIIMLAANARPLEDLIVEQAEYLTGLTPETPEAATQIELLHRQAANTKKAGTPEYDSTIPALFGIAEAYWAFSNSYKQVEVAKALQLPILILQGERDYQVTMEDYGLWRIGLMKNRNATFNSYPKLNHLFMEGGSPKSTPAEYMNANSIPTYVFDDISNWIFSL